MNISRLVLVLIIVSSSHVQRSYAKFKILVMMPFNGKSHFFMSEILFETLAQRGHDVTVLSPFPRKTPLNNYRDIDISTDDEGMHVLNMTLISSLPPIFITNVLFENGLEKVCREGLGHPNVQELLKSKDEYDIVITEMFNADCFLGFVHKFKASLIFLRTSTLSTWLGDRTANPDNPSFVPGTTSGHPSRMTFVQRLANTIYYIRYKLLYSGYNRECEKVAREHFGNDMPALSDIASGASFHLINSYFVHQYPKPSMPNVKEIGGLHVREPKPLPQDLENWISGATHGLIYFNLGSMLKTSTMTEDKRLAILKSFAGFPHRVLMKWEAEMRTPEIPDNVKLTTWSPQNDILHHPNVKLFITHGGMLGTIEAVHAGVPMIATPFYGDQLTNVVLLEERGLAVVLRYGDISYETFTEALKRVLDDPGYARRAKDLSAAFRDRPIPPLEEAIHWIEYVGRRKGTAAEFLLRSPIHDLAFYQYCLLDVCSLVLGGLLVICYSLYLIGRSVTRAVRGRCWLTGKQKTN